MSFAPRFAQSARDVTIGVASDTVDLVRPVMRANTPLATGWCDGVRVTTAGNLRVLTWNDQDIVIPVLAGEYVPLKVKRIFATNTTAAGFTCYWL